MQKNDSDYEPTTKIFDDSFDPYTSIEKNLSVFEIDYKKLNTYSYLNNYGIFLSNLTPKNVECENIKSSKDKNILTYIECLCKMYIGHNIHYKLKEEISMNTNISILKGDHLFSLGYFEIAKIGNPLLIKYYSKISQNLVKVRLYL